MSSFVNRIHLEAYSFKDPNILQDITNLAADLS